jgi:hypothetical protein
MFFNCLLTDKMIAAELHAILEWLALDLNPARAIIVTDRNVHGVCSIHHIAGQKVERNAYCCST